MVVADTEFRSGGAADWLWRYLTLERGTRLITGHQADTTAPAKPAAQALAA